MNSKSNKIICDILVVGSGPGSAVSAAILAEAGLNVVMIEEGQNLQGIEEFSIEEMKNKYRSSGMTFTLGSPKVLYVEGSCLGGGSEVNSGLYHRTPTEILSLWESEFQLKNSSYEEMKEFFALNEEDLGLEINNNDYTPSKLLQQAATRMSWSSLQVPRWYKNSVKQSMSRSFIPRFLQAGGKLLEQVSLKKFTTSKNQIESECLTKNGMIKILSRKLFLGAGAVATPILLRNNNFKKNIGNSIGLHPSLKVLSFFPDSVNLASDKVGSVQVREFAPKYSFGCSISRPAHLAMQLLNSRRDLQCLDKNYTNMAMYYVMSSPKTVGKVRKWPFIDSSMILYQLNQSDISVLKEGTLKLGSLLFEAGAKKIKLGSSQSSWQESITDFSNEVKSCPAKALNLMTIHLFGSCPMGEDQKRCAVNSFGQLFENENIYICDSSILCSSPNLNPQGSIMAFARRNAQYFVDNCKGL